MNTFASSGNGCQARQKNLTTNHNVTHLACRLNAQLDALGKDATASSSGGNQQPGPEDMSGLVDGIMHSLLAKDVLYQPIQEIGSRYPQWLADHRYTQSHMLVLDTRMIMTAKYITLDFAITDGTMR